MPITLSSNIAALKAQRQLQKVEGSISSSYNKLSSGLRINGAADDAAGLAISNSLRTDQRVYSQATRNLNDGTSFLSIADETVGILTGVVTRIQELAGQSANGGLSAAQRRALNTEAQKLKDEFTRISKSTNFNSLGLFDGTLQDGISLQLGYGLQGAIQSTLGGRMGDGTFTQGTSVTNSYTSDAIESADINGDGILDLVSVNGSDTRITVNLGNGDGTFGAGQSTSTGAGSFSSTTLADMNRDGILDVVGNYNGSVGIMLGSGTGSFSAPVSYSTSGTSTSLAVGDVNGDGNADVVTIGAAANIKILLGTASGALQAAQNISFTGSAANAILLNDMNGDGLADIVAATIGGASVLYSNGNGTFGNEQVLATAGGSPSAFGVGDFNGDGRVDVAASVTTVDQMAIFLGQAAGTFSAATNYSIGEGTAGIEVGDFNGDGNADLLSVAGLGGSFSILNGVGNGTFQQGQTESPGSPSRVALGDFNQDGVYDFATTESATAISVFLGDLRDGLAPILDFSLETQASARQALAPLARKLQSLSAQRGVIGAFQSRIRSALNVVGSSVENYAAAGSRIRDVDMAQETAHLSRLKITQSAGIAILAQANQQPGIALKLLASAAG